MLTGGLHGDDTGVFRGVVAACHLEGCPQWAVDVDLLWPGDHMVWRTLEGKKQPDAKDEALTGTVR